MRLIWRVLAVLLFVLAPAAYAAGAPPQTIVLASTTSVDNSGLLQAILPGFTKAANISVKVLAQGTGQALDTARRSDADLVLVHDPEAEGKSSAKGTESISARLPGTTSLSSGRRLIPPTSPEAATLSLR